MSTSLEQALNPRFVCPFLHRQPPPLSTHAHTHSYICTCKHCNLPPPTLYRRHCTEDATLNKHNKGVKHPRQDSCLNGCLGFLFVVCKNNVSKCDHLWLLVSLSWCCGTVDIYMLLWKYISSSELNHGLSQDSARKTWKENKNNLPAGVQELPGSRTVNHNV